MTTRRGAVLLTLCLGSFLINLDTTIVNVALPSLVVQLHATTAQLQWVVDAYNLVFATLVLAAGSLSDRFGRKRGLLCGLVVFGGGSLAGSFAGTSHQLIAARAVMGLGAALIFPATLSIISNVFVERRTRAKAIGLWGATTGVGIALGPIVGGWLLEHFWWGSVFVVMAPLAAVVAALAAGFVPDSSDPSTPRLDLLGLALSCVGMAALVYALIEAPTWGWSSARATAWLVVAAGVLLTFLVAERRAARPMLDTSLFRNLRFTAASASVTVAFFALSGFIFLVTQYFQILLRYSALGTGVRLLPVATCVAIGSVGGTKLAVRLGNKVVVTAGLVLLTTAYAWISTVTGATSYPTLAAQMVVLGSGMGLSSAPATEAIMGVVPRAKAGIGSAVNDATRLVGGTLGVAVIGSVAASLYGRSIAAALPAGLPARAAVAAHDSIGGALVASQRLAHAGLGHAAAQLREGSAAAFLDGFHSGCLVASGVAALGAVLAALLLPARPNQPGDAEDGPLVAVRVAW